MPSLDLTQMRDNMGSRYSPTSPSFDGQERLHAYSPHQSDTEDESRSPARTWSTIGGPESNIATSAVNSELYVLHGKRLISVLNRWMRGKLVRWCSL